MKITKEMLLINKDIALSEYDEFISLGKGRILGKELSIWRCNVDDKIDINFDKIGHLFIEILSAIKYLNLTFDDFKLSKSTLDKYDRSSRLNGFGTKEELIKYIDDYNFTVQNLSFAKLNEKLLIKKLYPKSTGYKSKRKSKPKHKLARYQKTKQRKLPRQVWWDLGEDLEFIEPELVKQFKEYFVNYYIYYMKDKYKRRANSVDKYKLMFQRMSEMQSKYELPK
jgi:hypothetical protein